jgi:REP-associated tyrosine transposase
MARANQLRIDGGVFHVTHRCHNRTFLLKFARDRDAYRRTLREELRQFDIAILDYTITCNHVHLLIDTVERSALSGFMQVVEGEFARAYNRRKNRQNAFWGDNHHASLVESGQYLWNCLCYIELNMVRCGVVRHPCEWKWVGYHEILGTWRRNRLIDLDRLCWRLGTASLEEVRKNLDASLAERIGKGQLKREPCWTESLAVGSVSFLEKIEPQVLSRRKTEIVQTAGEVWALQETPIPYGRENGLQKRAIGVRPA